MHSTYLPVMNTIRASIELKSTYLPVCRPRNQNMPTDEKYKYNEHTLSWWQDSDFFKYPYILVSAYYGIQEGENFREKFKIPNDVVLYADSGGFQLSTTQEYIDPLDVLRWQEATSDIGIILDYPPYGVRTRNFEKCMKKTAKNTELMYNNRSTDLKLFGVIQGNSWDRMSTWYSNMEHDMDGWSIKPSPSDDPMKVALSGAFAIENLQDMPLHILKVGGVNNMAIAIYLTKYFNGHITYDSSSYARGSMGKEYLVPFNFSQKFIFGDHRLKNLPCNCVICSQIKPEDLWADGSISGALIGLHNLHWFITYSYTLQALLEYEDMFMEFVKKICSKKVLHAIEYLDYFMEHGIEDANRKFSHYMKISSGLTQRSLRI